MRTVKQNHLVFRGTRLEVENAESIDRCWYLAWDTGELFVGNSVGGKTKYGGSAQTMSTKEITKYIESYFSEYITPQLESNTAEWNYVRGRIIDLDTEFNRFHTQINETITNKLNQIFDTMDAVNDILDKKIDESLERYVRKDELSEHLSDYSTTAQSDGKYLLPLSGNNIISNLENAVDGTYLALSNASKNQTQISKGTVYTITTSNGITSLNTVMVTGGGGGGSFNPSISTFEIIISDNHILKSNNVNYYFKGKDDINFINENGFSFPSHDINSRIKIKIKLANSGLISEKGLTFKINGKSINAGILINDYEQIIEIDNPLTIADFGIYVFELELLNSVQSSDDKVSQKIVIKVLPPIYYGIGPSFADNPFNMYNIMDYISNNEDKTYFINEKTTGIENYYPLNFTTEYNYFWVCLPKSTYFESNLIKLFDTDTGEGFGSINFIELTKDRELIQFNNIEYKCYRINNGGMKPNISMNMTIRSEIKNNNNVIL